METNIKIKTVYPTFKSKFIIKEPIRFLGNITERTNHSWTEGQHYEIISQDYHVGFDFRGHDTVMYAKNKKGVDYIKGLLNAVDVAEPNILNDIEVEDQIKP